MIAYTLVDMVDETTEPPTISVHAGTAVDILGWNDVEAKSIISVKINDEWQQLRMPTKYLAVFDSPLSIEESA